MFPRTKPNYLHAEANRTSFPLFPVCGLRCFFIRPRPRYRKPRPEFGIIARARARNAQRSAAVRAPTFSRPDWKPALSCIGQIEFILFGRCVRRKLNGALMISRFPSAGRLWCIYEPYVHAPARESRNSLSSPPLSLSPYRSTHIYMRYTIRRRCYINRAVFDYFSRLYPRRGSFRRAK